MNNPIIAPPTMDTQSPIDTSDSLWVAWTEYQATPEFANAKKWAEHVRFQLSCWLAHSVNFRIPCR